MKIKNNNDFFVQETMKIIDTVNGPFYLIFEDQIIDNLRYLKEVLSLLPSFSIFYSIKTNFETEVLKTVAKEGCGFDVSCPFDLFVADRHSFSGNKIVVDNFIHFREEAERIINSDVHMVHIESIKEAELIQKIASSFNKTINVGIRINFLFPHFDPVRLWFEFTRKSFGVSIPDLKSIAIRLKSFPNLNFKGLFTHAGLPYPVPADYVYILKNMFKLSCEMKKLGIMIDEFNIGGGFPNSDISYFNEIPSFIRKILFIDNIKNKMEAFDFRIISKAYASLAEKYCFSPAISIEPGNYIVDNAGFLCGHVINIYKNQIETDISLNDLAFKFPFKNRQFIITGKHDKIHPEKMNIVGPTCNPYDVLFRNVSVPETFVGDKIIIFNTGAYSIPRSIQHIRPRKAVYFRKKSGEVIKIREKENFSDLLLKQTFNQ